MLEMQGIFAAAALILWIGYSHAADASGDLSRICDAAMWNNLPGFADTFAAAWCNATVQDAVKNSRITDEELLRCRQSKDQQLKNLKVCEHDKSIQRAGCEEEKLLIEARCSAAQEESLAQVAYWKEKCQSRINVAECNLQKQKAAVDYKLLVNQTRSLDDDELQASQLRLAQAKLKNMEVSLASCRLQKSFAEATLRNSSEDEALVKKLKEQIQRLYVILTICGALFFGMIPAIVLFQTFRRNEREMDSSRKRDSIEVLTPSQALKRLEFMHETDNGCVKPLLTSLVFQGLSGVCDTPSLIWPAGEELFILLVPLNCYRSRNFALFGGGGDYSWETEASRYLVADRGTGSLLILLYDHTGRVFTEGTMKNLNLIPEEIAQKVVPSDCDFPTKSDVGVLWRSSTHLFVTNGDGIVEAPPVLWEQVWIQYLAR